MACLRKVFLELERKCAGLDNMYLKTLNEPECLRKCIGGLKQGVLFQKWVRNEAFS